MTGCRYVNDIYDAEQKYIFSHACNECRNEQNIFKHFNAGLGNVTAKKNCYVSNNPFISSGNMRPNSGL